MASSSSSSRSRTWRYNVFTSFHGPDARKTVLSHLRKQFSCNGISMFDDQGIERGQTIAPALTQAIRDSRISIVVLSKNYASSSWCLDELVEILKCQKGLGQIVMTVFYGVNPSDVRKQTGDLGKVFNKTCAPRTEEDRRKWSQALTDAGNIAGWDFQNWDNESEMIEKIARDVSNKLNPTISWDFKDIVGIEAHLEKLQSLLHLEYEDEALFVGISGPAGIGKTTIARALHSRLSSSFQLTYFMENVSGSYNKGLDYHGLRLSLQEKLLSKVLNEKGMKIHHLGAIPERLHDKKVLIILDDVDDMEQLEALANETSWFGRGSRIIITTKDQELLEQHAINNTYYVDFPTKEDAREILCRYAFKQSLAPDRFEKLVERVTELCSNLPLGLCVIGSTLRKKKEEDWECILHRLENSLDPKIEGVLRVGYDYLHKNDKFLFLLIALFFNYKDEDHVMDMLSEDGRYGLKILAKKSLIQKSTEGKIVMHKLLQQVGREAVQRQDQGKRQLLIDTNEFCDVLNNDSGSGSLMGISLDISTLTSDVYISSEAFKRMCNLQFLHIYKSNKTSVRVHVPDDMNFPPRLKLLHWEMYPGKCLPRTFTPEYLVELNLESNVFEKLWEGIQPLTNLKKMSLGGSMNLKELPCLSNASNLEKLNLAYCLSLVEIPSSIRNLQKLKHLEMDTCVKLQVVPSDFNLASLESVNMFGCWQLRKFPDIFKNITSLTIQHTIIEDLPESVRLWSRLRSLRIYGNGLRPLLEEEINLKLGCPDIEKIPDWIKDLHGLEDFAIRGCPKLASLPELPASLRSLTVDDCESLETLMPFPFESAIEYLRFTNCLKLGKEARRVITQQSSRDAWLPGRNVPEEFDHRAIGNSMTIPSGTIGNSLTICVVISPKQPMVEREKSDLLCRLQDFPIHKFAEIPPKLQTDHLVIRRVDLHGRLLEGDLLLEFSTKSKNMDIIECGFQRQPIVELLKSFISSIYESNKTSFDRVHVPDWEEYPGMCLPPTIRPEYLVELNLTFIKLEKLWEGIQPLANLKKMSLEYSKNLKELPDLSNASNLEMLNLNWCISLEEIPSSFGNLHKLKRLDMSYCIMLQIVPTHINLASLETVDMFGCYQLRKFPYISKNITSLTILHTMIEDLPESVRLWSRLRSLSIHGSGSILPILEEEMNLHGGPDIEKIPDCIRDLHGLEDLEIDGCPKLASLPELPASLRRLTVNDCESLETLMPFPLESPVEDLRFTNCLKLGEEACRVITQQSSPDVWLPGRNVPAEFTHRAIGNSLTIPSGTKECRICIVVSPKQKMVESADLLFRLQGFPVELRFATIPNLQTYHLCIRHHIFPATSESELLLEFSTTSNDIDIIECGFQNLKDKTNQSNESRVERLKSFLSSSFAKIERNRMVRKISSFFQEMCEEARRVITQQSSADAWLPGRNVPEEFNHRAIGNSLTIPSGTKECRICIVVSPKQQMVESADLLFRLQGFPVELRFATIPKLQTDHLFIRHDKFTDILRSELLLEFSTTSNDIDIIECSFQILTEKTNQSNESRIERLK